MWLAQGLCLCALPSVCLCGWLRVYACVVWLRVYASYVVGLGFMLMWLVQDLCLYGWFRLNVYVLCLVYAYVSGLGFYAYVVGLGFTIILCMWQAKGLRLCGWPGLVRICDYVVGLVRIYDLVEGLCLCG